MKSRNITTGRCLRALMLLAAISCLGGPIARPLAATQEQRKEANEALAEATRKVIHQPSDSPSRRLAEINTLRSAFIDPKTGRVSFLGIYDPTYASGPIAYADLLAETLEQPYPSFSLEEEPSKPARQAIRQMFDREMDRVASDPAYGRQWMKNTFWAILESKEPIPEKLVLDQHLKSVGLEPEGLAAFFDWRKSGGEFAGEEQYKLAKKFMGRLLAGVGIEERYGQALMLMSMIQQRLRAGEGENAAAGGEYRELAELLGASGEMRSLGSDPQASGRALWILFYGKLLKGLGEPAGQTEAMIRRANERSSGWDEELARAADARQAALTNEAFQKSIITSFVLTPAFLKSLYVLPAISSGVKLYGLRADSPLARAMFEADYALKYVTTLNPDTAALPGYLSSVQFLSAAAERSGRSAEIKRGLIRDWIRPGEARLEPFTDGSGVRFASATIRIGVEPLDEASKSNDWLRSVLGEYARRLDERYDDFARLYPSLHVMREIEKIIALARWIRQNGLRVDVPAARPVARPVPDRVEGFISFIYVRTATGDTDDVFVDTSGGVVFSQDEGDGWIKIQPGAAATRNAMEQLAASAALAQQASAAALSGNLEDARVLAQRSADAMIGRIDMSGLPGPVIPSPLAPGESLAGRAEVAQAAVAAAERNTGALARARADLRQAEPLRTSDPGRYAQVQGQAQAAVTQSEQNLRHLRDMMEKYRLKPADFPDAAQELRGLDPMKPVNENRPEKPAESGSWTTEQCRIAERRVAACRDALRQTVETAVRFNRTIAADQRLRAEWESSMTAAVERAKSRGQFLWLALPLGKLKRLNAAAAEGLEKNAIDSADLLAGTVDPGRRENIRIIRQFITREKNAVEKLGKAYENIEDAETLSEQALLIDDDPEESPTSPFHGDGMKLREAGEMLFNLIVEQNSWKRLAANRPWLKYLAGGLSTAFEAEAAARAMFDSWYDALDVWFAWKQLNTLNQNAERYLEAVQKLAAETRQRSERLRTAEREFAAECAKKK